MAASSNCYDRQSIERFCVGELPGSEAEELESHLGQCPRCLEVARSARRQDRFLATLKQASGPNPISIPVEDASLVTLMAKLCELPAKLDEPVIPEAGVESTLKDTPASQTDEGMPAHLGPYRILRKIGSGGMAVVYEGEHGQLGRRAAVKTFSPGHTMNPERLARFRREMEVIAQLRHPNVVEIYEIGESLAEEGGSPLPWYAMEYVEGGSLAHLLAGGPVPSRVAAELMAALARATHAAHERNVIHRDLKPGNVLLVPASDHGDGNFSRGLAGVVPKIADFGLAKCWQEGPADNASGLETQSGTILGTPAYMAPEQATGHSQRVGTPSDIYSLGAILYEALTGYPPFRAATVLETLELVRSRDPIPPRQICPGLPKDLETICLKCLEKSWTRRYATAKELAEDLCRFLDGVPIRARPVSRTERVVRWARRKPAWASLIVVSCIAAMGLGAGGLIYERELREAVETAKAERQRTEDLYREARSTIADILKRLKERDAGEIPRLMELEKQQLGDALQFYEFVAGRLDPSKPELRPDVAKVYQEIAGIQLDLGEPRQAEEYFRKAAGLWQVVLEESPQSSEARGKLAHCWNGLGVACAGQQRREESLRFHQQALRAYDALLAEEPGNEDWRFNLAVSHQLLGVLFHRSASPEAVPHFEKVADLCVPLVGSHRDNIEFVAMLAQACNNLAVVHTFSKEYDRAEEVLQRAEWSFGAFEASPTTDARMLMTMGTVYQSWGNLRRYQGRTEDALRVLAKAQGILEIVVQREPLYAKARYSLANVHGTRAMVLIDRGRYQEAVPDWDCLVQLAEEPGRYVYRLDRALLLALAGELSRAEAEVDELASHVRSREQDARYKLAVALAHCVKGHQDRSRGSASSLNAAGQDGARAVALLAEACKDGFFRDPKQREKLTTDPELAPLRSRTDFQQLLKLAESQHGN